MVIGAESSSASPPFAPHADLSERYSTGRLESEMTPSPFCPAGGERGGRGDDGSDEVEEICPGGGTSGHHVTGRISRARQVLRTERDGERARARACHRAANYVSTELNLRKIVRRRGPRDMIYRARRREKLPAIRSKFRRRRTRVRALASRLLPQAGR